MSGAAPFARVTSVFAAIAIVGIAGVGVALVSQHVFGMQPCPWCVLQRVILIAIALVAMIGWARPAGPIAAGAAALAFLLACGGMAAAGWQHFRAAAAASCKLTVADRIVSGIGLDRAWPDVFEARASCSDSVVDLLGVPYDFWSLGLFLVLAAAAAWLLWRQRTD